MKIAILGKSPTRRDAPFDDPSWTIWGVGLAFPGDLVNLAPHDEMVPMNRWDAWFEVHDMRHRNPETQDPTHSQAFKWLSEQTKPIYTLGTMDVPAAVPLPRDELEQRFGKFFMRNTICWAMAYALHLGCEELGLWGVEQNGSQEYARERHGVQHFIYLARALGVPVFLPETCALRQVPKPYPDFYY